VSSHFQAPATLSPGNVPLQQKTVHWFGSGTVWTLWTEDGFLLRIESHYNFCGAPPPELSLRQLNPAHIFTHYYEIHFNVIPQFSFNFCIFYSNQGSTYFRLHQSVRGQLHCSLMLLLKDMRGLAWTALIWLRTGSSGVLWQTRRRNFGFHKTWGIC
jgi:hypothetical protein